MHLVGAPHCKADVVLPREMTYAEGKALSDDSRRPAEYDHGLGRDVRQQDFGALSLSGQTRLRGGVRARRIVHMTCGRRSSLAQGALFILCLLLVACALDAALAQPFGMSRGSAPPPQFGPFTGWILEKQAEFYRMLSGTIRAAKTDGSAAYTLMGISFLYGIFHAAGPGHGKAVISSYLVANDETWRRGVVLSFASAILQALTAIVIVGVAAVLLNATAHAMGNTVRIVEMVELRADHGDRAAAVVGEGARLPALAAAASA